MLKLRKELMHSGAITLKDLDVAIVKKMKLEEKSHSVVEEMRRRASVESSKVKIEALLYFFLFSFFFKGQCGTECVLRCKTHQERF